MNEALIILWVALAGTGVEWIRLCVRRRTDDRAWVAFQHLRRDDG